MDLPNRLSVSNVVQPCLSINRVVVPNEGSVLIFFALAIQFGIEIAHEFRAEGVSKFQLRLITNV